MYFIHGLRALKNKHMCLSIPGKLVQIVGELDPIFRVGKVSFDGVMKEVNLTMVPEAQIGDYVLVHVGAAIGIIDEAEAKRTFDLIREMGGLEEDEFKNWDNQNSDS
jgi:hydrogenase expression/formation protein HypC